MPASKNTLLFCVGQFEFINEFMNKLNVVQIAAKHFIRRRPSKAVAQIADIFRIKITSVATFGHITITSVGPRMNEFMTGHGAQMRCASAKKRMCKEKNLRSCVHLMLC